MSLAFKSKANSSIYTSSRDDIDNNNNTKYKFDEFYTLYKETLKNDNKKRTANNMKQSRNYNHNYFTVINRQSNKKNNLSQQNTIININSYLQKNYSTNNLRKNGSNKRNNSNRAKPNFRLNSQNSSSFNITNNTYNMNKNNIMINLNPKNVNVNVEKLKVQKKLHEYQRLIDQKLNELVKNKNPHIHRNKFALNIRHNSSPNIIVNNSQKKPSNSLIGINYYLKKRRKKSSAPNIYVNNNQGNNISKKFISKSTMDAIKKRNFNQRNNIQNSNIKKKKCNSEFINNMKQSLNKASFNSKNEDSTIIKDESNSLAKGKTNLSLRKFIFSKCSNPISKTIKIH